MKYEIITFGCQMNKSDSERIANKLEKEEYKLIKSNESADLMVINVCSIRQSAINRVFSRIQKIRLQQPKTKIILTGCILEKDKKKFKEQVNDIWTQIDFKKEPKCESSQQAFIPIMTGCNNFCSYCVVPYTRGREKSQPAKKIIKQVRDLVKKGYDEIVLLGQNVNSYQDKNFDFPKLLKALDDIPGYFQIKFLTSHPKDMSDELIKVIAQSNKISKEIHLPVQSGDNQILKKMNRGYTVGHYKNLIKKIRKKIPNARISTDIIIGFPNETEKQFKNTVKLIKEIKFSQAYISSYSPRNQTSAAKLKDNITSDEKKKRKRILLQIFK
ncbi:MAG: MiaB/RimO family radical SAM methylthiotransferase [bacterium]